MVFIVFMDALVSHFIVRMVVLVVFNEMQREADAHRHSGRDETTRQASVVGGGRGNGRPESQRELARFSSSPAFGRISDFRRNPDQK
jgi:hypothetical protein